MRQLRIISKIRETTDTFSFVLEPVDGKLYSYLSGQFLSIVTESHGLEQRRAYSFSSSPLTDALPIITVKRISNGALSGWLFDHAREGDLLTVTEAAGRFLLPKPLPKTLFYIAAGSGITPVMSHIKTLLKQAESPKIVLFYANRDAASTIFKTQIDQWIAEYAERLQVTYFFSRERNAVHAVFRHLNNELLEQQIRAYFGGRISAAVHRQTAFFLCAPLPLVRMAEMTLRVLDFPVKNIHKELFQADARQKQRTVDTSKTHRVRVEHLGQVLEFQTFEGETILNAALRQGISLPYSCKSGVCFSCLLQCTQGAVDVEFTESVRREGPGGSVNTCIGYAVTEQIGLRGGISNIEQMNIEYRTGRCVWYFRLFNGISN
ncbi:MAG: ferredoxin--NADP reductase [Bacteroidota bacterium]